MARNMNFAISEIEGRPKTVKGAVFNNSAIALEVRFEGYGDNASKPGYGTPVIFEVYQGKLRLIVFADINKEEPTHVINLEGARESKYRSR